MKPVEKNDFENRINLINLKINRQLHTQQSIMLDQDDFEYQMSDYEKL